MVAPTFAAISAIDSGTGTADRTPAVPTGVANGSFVGIAVAANAATNGAEATDFDTIVAATQANASAQAEWKRATGADAGTYSVPHSGSGANFSTALAFRVEGELATGNPIGDTDFNSATGVTTVPTTSLVGTTVDSLLVHVVWSFNARTYTPPSGFTRQTASASQRLHLSTMVSPGGNTGNINGSMGTAGMTGALLFEILPASSSQTVTPSGFDTTVTFGTPTLVPDQSLSVTGFDVAVSFGSPTLIPDQSLSVTGFALTVDFGTPSLVSDQFVTPTGLDLPLSFGTPTLVQDQQVSPDGFDLPVSFGTPTLATVLSSTGFDLALDFGTPTVLLDDVLTVTGFDLNVTFGTVTLTGQPFVTATVYDHETGLPVGAGAVVQLFNSVTGELIDTTVTDTAGVYLFHLPMGFTDDVFTVVRVTIDGTEYQGVSEVCPVQT
jgi:hypothetical protein